MQQLARYANTVDAQTITRLSDERRCAALLAFITTLEATATDEVLDLFDIVMTRMVNEAQKLRKELRLRGVRDLDVAALTLRKAWAVAMTTHVQGKDGVTVPSTRLRRTKQTPSPLRKTGTICSGWPGL